jgi:hypothetical protein
MILLRFIFNDCGVLSGQSNDPELSQARCLLKDEDRIRQSEFTIAVHIGNMIDSCGWGG